MYELNLLLAKILIPAIPILFAITVHEVAHGWIAEKLGDKTARMLGRITLNPIKHIDPVGTIIVPALLYWFGGFIFGWAKPVPVTWQNLHNPKRDMAFVAIAGPLANLMMAFLWVIVFKITPSDGTWAWLWSMAQIGILINMMLMVLNMLPIPPLDGSRVLSSLLPNKLSLLLQRIEPYGFLILLLLIATGLLQTFMQPILYKLTTLMEML